MIQHSIRTRAKRWTLFSVIAMLGIFIVPFSTALAFDIVTNDYFLNHQSIEPVYKAKKLDPTVLIHVREVVLKGRERTAPAAGRVLLLAHGAATAGYVGFDGGCEKCSMMRYFAQAGWDVFSLDYENYGLSTFSPVMDNPSWYPDETPTTTEVAVSNIERVVDFICNLRGVEKVNLFGWSFGAIRATPIYTLRHPGKVAKLVLFGGAYGGSDEKARQQGEGLKKMKVLYSTPSPAGWMGYGTKVENLHPGAWEWFRDAILATDPKAGELGGQYRFPAGPISDIYLAPIQFDASKIAAPTLVIRAGNDIAGSTEDNKKLIERLGSKVKKYIEIPVGGHYIFFEKTNAEFYKAIKDFLEEKTK
jgi:pimeloyl-ACP methyl ester carboxylesterase